MIPRQAGRRSAPVAEANPALVLAPPPPPPRPAIVTPLAPERYKVQFTVSRETHDKLRRAQDLLRHSIPNGDPAAIFDRALTLLLADLEQAKLAATERAARGSSGGVRLAPHSGGCQEGGLEARRRPVRVRRDATDVARSAASWSSITCGHTPPVGRSVVDNLELRCRAHNVYEAEKYFGSRLPLLVREAGRPAYHLATRSGPS